MDALKVLQEANETAQAELVGAEVAYIEASARVEAAREARARLNTAVAVLSGELPSATDEQPAFEASKELLMENQPDPLPPSNPDRAGMADLTPEEFDAQRKRRQRARKKEEDANNPLAHVKCSGCGTKGTLQETIIQAPSGAPVKMMICNSCGNQLMT